MTVLKRRRFLKQQLALAAAVGGGMPLVQTVRSAHGASTAGGYKALVCVYLAGGNDSFNMFVPQSNNDYQSYATARQGIAIPRDQLLPVSPTNYNDGSVYGFHPNMPHARDLFNSGELGLVANVGPLIRPTTKAEYEANVADTPAQLFSHNDQTDLWMLGQAGGASGSGWAGRMMDLFYGNGTAAPRPSPSLSVAGDNLWMTGDNVRQFEVTSSGVGSLDFPWHDGPYKLDEAYKDMYAAATTQGHLMTRAHARIQQRAIDYGFLVNNALSAAPVFSESFGGGALQSQLEMVAKLIAVRDALDSGISRQVFFVRLGGWDTHASQNDSTTSSHANLLGHVSQSLWAFNAAMTQLGMKDQVTVFTASEFGRTLTPNGDGTDHGWGGHSLVMGGAVKGKGVYGRMPLLALGTDDAVENGRIIPTTSVDQYAATLASWFGLSAGEIDQVFPNIGNFSIRNLGFMLG